jgi:hypothetical protein
VIKKCSKCGEIKSMEDFHKSPHHLYGVSSQCKACACARTRAHQKQNADKYRKAAREYYASHKIHAKARMKAWESKNRERVNVTHRLWGLRNPDKVKSHQESTNKIRRGSPKGQINARMAAAVRRTLRSDARNGHGWEKLVGYTVVQLKNHLEKQFLPGMTWENRKLWDIDHIIPLSAFNFQSPENIDFKKAWDLKNLRPLWRFDNRSKGSRINKPFQPSLMI